MRLFVGSFATIENYKQIKERFSFIQGRWVAQPNLHLTLLFLGEVRVPESIIYRLAGLRYEPIRIPIRGLGFFGSPARVLFAKAESETLEPIHHQICDLLDHEPDRLFRPHVTLCRIKQIKNYQRFIEHVRAYEERELGHLDLRIALIKSELTPKGPIYTPLRTF